MQAMHFLFPYLLHGYHNDDGANFYYYYYMRVLLKLQLILHEIITDIYKLH